MLVGAVLVCFFVAKIGVDAIILQLRHVGPDFVWLLVAYALGTTIGAFPWAWLLPPSARPSISGIIAGRFAASGANALLPFFGLAGEPSRLLWLSEPARVQGLAAIVVDRVLYNCACALLLLVGALVGLAGSSLPASIGNGAILVAVSILVASAGALWAAAHFGIGRRIHALLSRAFGKQYAQTSFGARLDEELLELLRGPKRPLYLGLLVHFAGRSVLALEAGVALRVLHVRGSFSQSLVLGVVPVALSFFVSWVPSQIGVQEGAQSLIASAVGLAPATGFAVVLLQRLRQLAFVALTPVLIGLSRPKSKIETKSESAPAPNEVVDSCDELRKM